MSRNFVIITAMDLTFFTSILCRMVLYIFMFNNELKQNIFFSEINTSLEYNASILTN